MNNKKMRIFGTITLVLGGVFSTLSAIIDSQLTDVKIKEEVQKALTEAKEEEDKEE